MGFILKRRQLCAECRGKGDGLIPKAAASRATSSSHFLLALQNETDVSLSGFGDNLPEEKASVISKHLPARKMPLHSGGPPLFSQLVCFPAVKSSPILLLIPLCDKNSICQRSDEWSVTAVRRAPTDAPHLRAESLESIRFSVLASKRQIGEFWQSQYLRIDVKKKKKNHREVQMANRQ